MPKTKKKPAPKSTYVIQCKHLAIDRRAFASEWQDWYEWVLPKPHLLHLVRTRVRSMHIEFPNRKWRLIKRIETVIVPENEPTERNEQRPKAPQKR